MRLRLPPLDQAQLLQVLPLPREGDTRLPVGEQVDPGRPPPELRALGDAEVSIGGDGVDQQQFQGVRGPQQSDALRAAGSQPLLLDLATAMLRQLAAALTGADAFVCAAGIGRGGSIRAHPVDRDAPLTVADAAELAGVRCYLMLSALGADPAMEYPADPEVQAFMRGGARWTRTSRPAHLGLHDPAPRLLPGRTGYRPVPPRREDWPGSGGPRGRRGRPRRAGRRTCDGGPDPETHLRHQSDRRSSRRCLPTLPAAHPPTPPQRASTA